MQYRIICYGPRLVGYGPFDSVNEARNYADKYLQDYRTEFVMWDEHCLTTFELAIVEAHQCQQ